MNFSKSNCPSLIALLLITIKGIESLTAETTISQQDQPYWQTVLRDFVFRTVASPQLDDVLYKKLLNAPFYGGPLREVFNDEDALLSSGNVYRLPGGRWIFCQDNCAKCDNCELNKNSTVKWTLRRVKRWASPDRTKWDLQVTVFPQFDEVPSEKGGSVTGRIERNAYLSGMGRSNWKGLRFRGNEDRSEDSIVTGKKQLEEPLEVSGLGGKSTDFKRVKRYRPKARTIRRPRRLAFHYPQEDVARINSPIDKLRDWTPRLIMGIDQHGEKHLVHVVPVDSLVKEVERSGYYSGSRGSYQMGYSPRISRTIRQNQDEAPYQTLIDRILDSLNTHRNFIETFLFSDRLETEFRNEGIVSPYLSYHGEMNEDEKFEGRNEADYRSLSSPRANRYPVNSEYQNEEQDESYRRYADMSQEVNRPERGKLIDDYEPYGISANDRHQDESSLPRAESERRRRDYFGKLTDSSSTLGHQELDEYHTKRDKTDSGFSINRNKFGNSSDQKVENRQLIINQSEPRRENFPVESDTIKLPADRSDGSS